MMKSIANWSLGAATLLILGCSGGSGVKTVPVSGTVYLDGKPLANAEINFFNEETNFLGSGSTDAQGHYELYQGAAVGKNKVWVKPKGAAASSAASESGDFDEPPESDMAEQEAMTQTQEEAGKKKKEGSDEKIPVKFSDPEKTVLTYDVPSGGAKTADFRLNSK